MQRFCRFARLGLAAVAVPLLVCSCSEPPPNPGIGAKPPGMPSMDDPRSRGTFDEIPDGKGGIKKIWVKITPEDLKAAGVTPKK